MSTAYSASVSVRSKASVRVSQPRTGIAVAQRVVRQSGVTMLAYEWQRSLQSIEQFGQRRVEGRLVSAKPSACVTKVAFFAGGVPGFICATEVTIREINLTRNHPARVFE